MLGMIMVAAAAVAAPTATPARSTANLASYLSDDDYPKEAIRNGEQGTVAFRLEVSPSGSVAGCTVTGSSGSRLLDEATCRILSERAQFSPARDKSGRAVADSVTARVRWLLPEAPTAPLPELHRATHNIWEVTADGRERSCRRELLFEGGQKLNFPDCIALDQKFVAAAAAYLGARPAEILTIRLDNRWLIDPVLPFAPPPPHHGELLARGEGDYRLNADLTVRDCAEGRFSARFNWKTRPCFRESFARSVPAGTAGVRMEVQWVVSRGPDTERPSALPSFVDADGKTFVPSPVPQRQETSSADAPGTPAPPSPR